MPFGYQPNLLKDRIKLHVIKILRIFHFLQSLLKVDIQETAITSTVECQEPLGPANENSNCRNKTITLKALL